MKRRSFTGRGRRSPRVREAFPSKFVQVLTEYFPFEGGFNTATPSLHVPPTFAKDAQNYEVDVDGGYTRQIGYERSDGRPAPSAAAYAVMDVTITGAFAAGNTITGVTSGATAVVLEVVTSTTPDYLVITKIVGVFVSGETLNVAGNPQGTTSSAAKVDGASTRQLHGQYKNLAADNYRADIAVVPGSGNILGGWRLGSTNYAFRNNAGGTAAAIYKSSAGGWVNVPVGEEISFTAGSGDVDEGDTLTQGGVTATIKRRVITSGTLAAGTAAGRLVIHSRAGGNFANGAATTTGAGALTLSGVQTAITILPTGRYECVSAKFGTNAKRIYGCDKVNRGFEFDGTDYSYTPITTGMAADTPTHVSVSKNHLFFAFGPSAQHSGIGTPYVWTVVSGAAELATGDDITAFSIEPGSADGGALGIILRNRVNILYGSSSADWNLVPYREELGALEYSVQQIGFTMMLDDRGVMSLQTAQVYGNFVHAALTRGIQDWINEKRPKIRASCISRDKSQYRVFFSDKYALYITVEGNKVRGMLPQLFVDDVMCAWSVEDADGSEVMYFGSSDGFVYQMDRGTSFDGDAVEHFLYMVFNPSKTPRKRKRYRKAAFEIQGTGYAEFQFSFELGYASSDIEPSLTQTVSVALTNQTWDVGTWDVGRWDGQSLTPSAVGMEGTAENVSLRIYGNSDYFAPLTFSGAHLHYSLRRGLR